MNTVSVSEVKNDFSGSLERAANEDFIVTNTGKPVAVIPLSKTNEHIVRKGNVC